MKRKKGLAVLIGVLFMLSCESKKIEITRDYIKNDFWGTKNSYGVDIHKIIITDSNILNETDLNGFDLRYNYKIDSSFSFFLSGNRILNKDDKIVYFDKIQSDINWTNNNDLTDKRNRIGKLDLDTWYLLKRLNGTYEYFVYIDEQGKVQHYAVNPVNF